MRMNLSKATKPIVRRSLGGATAFGGGKGHHAFRDPATMVAPDQAFSAAMAKPQGSAQATPALPALPMPPMPPSG